MVRYIAITDTHFGHDNLWKKYKQREQGFEQKLLDSIKKAEGEIFIHLGDVCMAREGYWHEQLHDATRLYKTRILIRGNHDTQSYSWYLRHGWDAVMEYAQMKIEGKEVLFSHRPIPRDQINMTPYGLPVVNFHGHLHGKGEASHRITKKISSFNYDIAPDNHGMGIVSINNLLSLIPTPVAVTPSET